MDQTTQHGHRPHERTETIAPRIAIQILLNHPAGQFQFLGGPASMPAASHPLSNWRILTISKTLSPALDGSSADTQLHRDSVDMLTGMQPQQRLCPFDFTGVAGPANNGLQASAGGSIEHVFEDLVSDCIK